MGGWETVDAKRHPEMMPKGYVGSIEREGMLLCERPLEITQDPLVTNNHLHTHNEYLSQLSQFGIVGFILFLGLLISLLRACWDWRRQPVQACILAVVLIFSLNALSDSSLHNEWEGWTLVFFGGLVLSQRFAKEHRFK
jgi:Kef-type K+ transport system membrane component KefB